MLFTIIGKTASVTMFYSYCLSHLPLLLQTLRLQDTQMGVWNFQGTVFLSTSKFVFNHKGLRAHSYYIQYTSWAFNFYHLEHHIYSVCAPILKSNQWQGPSQIYLLCLSSFHFCSTLPYPRDSGALRCLLISGAYTRPCPICTTVPRSELLAFSPT